MLVGVIVIPFFLFSFLPTLKMRAVNLVVLFTLRVENVQYERV